MAIVYSILTRRVMSRILARAFPASSIKYYFVALIKVYDYADHHFRRGNKRDALFRVDQDMHVRMYVAL